MTFFHNLVTNRFSFIGNFTTHSRALLIAIPLAFAPATVYSEGDDPDLITMMGNLQLFMHKAGLSVRAGNLELADFYAHEIEETLEVVGEVESYDDFPIGQLSDAMLVPAVEKFGEGLDSGSVDAALDSYISLINACNACHQVTDHGFIKIEDRSDLNIYMQNFGM